MTLLMAFCDYLGNCIKVFVVCSLVFNDSIQHWIRPLVILLNASGIICHSTGCGFSSKTCFSTCQESNCHKRWRRERVRIWIAFFSHPQHSLLIWVFITLCFYFLLLLCHILRHVLKVRECLCHVIKVPSLWQGGCWSYFSSYVFSGSRKESKN